MSSSNSTTSQYRTISPCRWIYRRRVCDTNMCSRNNYVAVSDEQSTNGKLFYSCTCTKFLGWAIPTNWYANHISASCPSPLTYQSAECIKRSCRAVTKILIADTAANRGKLFYKCGTCKSWSGWCLPVNSGTGQPSAPPMSNREEVDQPPTAEMGRPTNTTEQDYRVYKLCAFAAICSTIINVLIIVTLVILVLYKI